MSPLNIKQLNFREANISDLQDLKKLGITSYNEFSKVLSNENWKKMNSFLNNEDRLANLIDKSTVFVCEKNAEIIGMIYLVSSGNATELFQSNWSYIRFLGVNTEYRGLGIGKKLTELCMEQAIKANENYIALHTSEFMDAARTIYENRGFKAIKEIEYLGKKYWIYLFKINNNTGNRS